MGISSWLLMQQGTAPPRCTDDRRIAETEWQAKQVCSASFEGFTNDACRTKMVLFNEDPEGDLAQAVLAVLMAVQTMLADSKLWWSCQQEKATALHTIWQFRT